MNTPVLLKPKEIKPMRENLSQGEVQQLLHILRETLSETSCLKDRSKDLAGLQWLLSNKEDPATCDEFYCFSEQNKAAKESKQKEKKIVSLITKLKGLR